MNEPQCPRCGGNLTYVQQYNRWYCQRCAAYIDPAPQNQPPQRPPDQFAQAPQQYPRQGVQQKEQSMVYVQGQDPYQQQAIQPGQGKVCKQCGTVNELWSVTCKKCRGMI